MLGSYCNNPTYYSFGVTSWGRLVFCGSPRRYEPRWFRSPEMHGIKEENCLCPAMEGEVAQAPDGLFLTCVAKTASILGARRPIGWRETQNARNAEFGTLRQLARPTHAPGVNSMLSSVSPRRMNVGS